jgi:hypothetical protein
MRKLWTRRSAIAVTMLALTQRARGSETNQQERSEIDRWMTEWMNREKAANGTLFVGKFLDAMWFLTRTIDWQPSGEQAKTLKGIEVPVGFVTDFASIPRAFYSLLSPTGQYTWAAVIHDYLYWVQDRPREQADLVLKHAMEDCKVDAVTIMTVYAGVRAGGSFAWDSNVKAKAGGEKRILKLFPDSPAIYWDDFKKRKGVFVD